MRTRGALVACALALAALAACSFQHGHAGGNQPPADTGSGGGPGSDAGMVDAPLIDAPVVPDAAVSTTCGSDCTDEGGTCSGDVCQLPTTGGLTCPQMNQCTI